jgi:aspartate 1-decarboxylase
MFRQFLRAKIHRATVTEANLDYVGSLAIDQELLHLSGLEENEVVQVANITNGERLITYVIRAPFGSRTICANGAAAHKIHVGDQIIVFGFAFCTEAELANLQPKLVFVDEANNPVGQQAQERYAETF